MEGIFLGELFATYTGFRPCEILAVLFGAHALAVAICNLTPTPRDDAYVAQAYRVIEIAAGLLTKKVKQ